MAPSHTLSYRLNVCAFPASDVPGKWVAECLELDLVTQGNDAQHAIEMLEEAVRIMVTESESFPALLQPPDADALREFEAAPIWGTFDVGVLVRWEADSSQPTYEVKPARVALAG